MHLHPLHTSIEKPLRFNDPFDYEPHPLCLLAADEVNRFIASQSELLADAQRGKMFGVLIVEQGKESALSYIAAYSGLLAGRNDWPFFVPPVFDAQQPDGHFKQTERLISSINAQLSQLSSSSEASSTCSSEVLALKQQRKQMSEELQLWLFSQYRMLNALGETKDLVEIWRDYHRQPKIQQRFPLPPGGSGDCCAPKLLQYAYQHGLTPVAIAEFWYGASPKGEIRHHGQFYPACRGKCLPILTHMLKGLDVDETPSPSVQNLKDQLEVLYADETILVVNKPSGLLSVPGRIEAPSVETILSEKYGRVFMPHRLDMDTSGLMVVARNEDAYKHLQQQFYSRIVSKKYIALLDVAERQKNGKTILQAGDKGTISLPLRPDPLDRPRQVVDSLHGKQAVTDFEVLSVQKSAVENGCESAAVLVSLIPHTGRTHQLRVHCAHPDGLSCPIVGDPLYGKKAQRLCLHAAELSFHHPSKGEQMHFTAPRPDFYKEEN